MKFMYNENINFISDILLFVLFLLFVCFFKGTMI